jgi:HEPN domain-containing protein
MPANWIAFARRDVQAAHVLQHNGIYEEACFHAQQAAEKALKAFLLHNG